MENKEYEGNQKLFIGKTPEAGKPVGDSPMKNDLAVTPVTGDKLEVEKTVGATKGNIEDAWNAKQSDVVKRVPDNPEIFTSKEKPAADQTTAAQPRRENTDY